MLILPENAGLERMIHYQALDILDQVRNFLLHPVRVNDGPAI